MASFASLLQLLTGNFHPGSTAPFGRTRRVTHDAPCGLGRKAWQCCGTSTSTKLWTEGRFIIRIIYWKISNCIEVSLSVINRARVWWPTLTVSLIFCTILFPASTVGNNFNGKLIFILTDAYIFPITLPERDVPRHVAWNNVVKNWSTTAQYDDEAEIAQ